ncbi:OLC1v1010949C1 [Oldenlandia corymbosa var. corymbosa]|uniref:rRNA adenine N(6)-methyltransferase n=1 Tax=Oldenlandia corymbosa var. corymbosa TaxID=529605 RepID=A0AAV1DSQ7_OLDCO|nr:OLC1v1010949C1 [Oldenlandia corymbosa var. corymbosa]
MIRCCRRSFTSKFHSIISQHLYPVQLQPIRTNSTRGFNLRDSDREDDEDDENGCSSSGTEVKIAKDKIQLFKSRGQHLLTNPRVLDTIVRRSEINQTDTVLEIGPGTGNLTMKLLEAAKNVVAIEIDKRMVEILHRRVSERGCGSRLTVINNDALKAEFPPFDLVVANIPFGISSPLVAKFLFGGSKFRNATLLIQKEFARRLLADPGESEYNRLAANVKLVADVEFVMDVSKRDFLPVPKVDCSVVKIHPKDYIPTVHEGFNLNEWWAFTRVCFSKKNKTLGATFKKKRKLMELMKLSKSDVKPENFELCDDGSDSELDDNGHDSKTKNDSPSNSKDGMSLFKDKVMDILRSAGCESKRPSKLSNEELLHLLYLFNQAGIYFYDQSQLKDATEDAFEASYDPM